MRGNLLPPEFKSPLPPLLRCVLDARRVLWLEQKPDGLLLLALHELSPSPSPRRLFRARLRPALPHHWRMEKAVLRCRFLHLVVAKGLREQEWDDLIVDTGRSSGDADLLRVQPLCGLGDGLRGLESLPGTDCLRSVSGGRLLRPTSDGSRMQMFPLGGGQKILMNRFVLTRRERIRRWAGEHEGEASSSSAAAASVCLLGVKDLGAYPTDGNCDCQCNDSQGETSLVQCGGAIFDVFSTREEVILSSFA